MKWDAGCGRREERRGTLNRLLSLVWCVVLAGSVVLIALSVLGGGPVGVAVAAGATALGGAL